MRRPLGVLLALVVLSGVWFSPAAGQTEPVDDGHHLGDLPGRPRGSAGSTVEFGYTFENPTAATAFPGFFESIPVDAVDLVARDPSGELLAGPTAETDGFETWLVAFRSPLEPGESVAVSAQLVDRGRRFAPRHDRRARRGRLRRLRARPRRGHMVRAGRSNFPTGSGSCRRCTRAPLRDPAGPVRRRRRASHRRRPRSLLI